MGILQAVFLFLRALLLRRAAAAVENLALRQQVAVLNQSVKRPKLRPRDRIFWVLLSRCWPNWLSALVIVQPGTVIKWHRMGFRLYWRWKSRARRNRVTGWRDISFLAMLPITSNRELQKHLFKLSHSLQIRREVIVKVEVGSSWTATMCEKFVGLFTMLPG